ncbi:MAG: thioesterase family protein [Deltaproteobacteria bacterium]|nr:thioesterase family protein [Deltaproteobacteria bacterium]MBW2666720.1 thioesterase family protein [Deltaproteobacteria bacterium]
MSSEATSTPKAALSAATGLAAASAVKRLRNAPGWYTADLCSDWNFLTPSGGVLMSIALRAMQAELDDPELRPLSANTLFMSPVPAGPMEIRVELLRRGGVAAQLRAELSSTTLPGPGLEVSATFARRLPNGPAFTDATFPDVPWPEDVPREKAEERPIFFDNLEIVQVEGPAVFSEAGWEASDALVTRWYRYRVPQYDAAGRFDRFALPPIIDNMPPAAFARIGSDGPLLHAPSLDLTVHFLDDCDDEWLLLRHRAKKAHDGFATADVEVWSRGGKLVAVGSQMMIFRSMPADPPPGFRRSNETS